MPLSSDLVSQFVKVTREEKQKKEAVVYGTIKLHEGVQYVQLDGSELFTPFSTTTDTLNGERVTVMIKNHNAVVTGNISSPSAKKSTNTTILNYIPNPESKTPAARPSFFNFFASSSVGLRAKR